MRFAAVKCRRAEKRGLRAPNKHIRGILWIRQKKAVKITALVLVAVVIAAVVVLSGLAIARAVEIDNAENYAIEYGGGRMNVIFMIGDGMGFNHVAAAEAKY